MIDNELLSAIKKERSLSAKHRNKEYIDKISAKLIKYYSDEHKKFRMSQGLCKYCYYMNTDRIGGAAMTKAECNNCGQIMTFGNTCTDILCNDCAVELKLCKHCSQKLD